VKERIENSNRLHGSSESEPKGLRKGNLHDADGLDSQALGASAFGSTLLRAQFRFEEQCPRLAHSLSKLFKEWDGPVVDLGTGSTTRIQFLRATPKQ
jgi:hypothetical protein